MTHDPFRDAASTRQAIDEAHTAIDQMERDAKSRPITGDNGPPEDCPPDAVPIASAETTEDESRRYVAGALSLRDVCY